MRRTTVITPPTEAAREGLVSLDAAKEFLRVEGDLEDGTITRLLDAIVSEAETAHGVCLVVQGLRYTVTGLALAEVRQHIKLPRTPVRSVESVTLIERNGTETVIDPAAYLVRGDDVVFLSPPRANSPIVGYEVEFTAGFGTVGSGVDADILVSPHFVWRAVLQSLADAFEFRESVVIGTTVTVLPEQAKARFSGLMGIAGVEL